MHRTKHCGVMETMLGKYVKYLVEVEGVVLNDLDSRVQARVVAMRLDMVKLMGGNAVIPMTLLTTPRLIVRILD